jgi:hypothetical protein
MGQNGTSVNGVAPLKNVGLLMESMERVINRSRHLPGMTCFYGESGLGKSMAAGFMANSYRAYYIQARFCWTKRAMLLATLKEMGIAPERTMPEMVEQIGEQLLLSQRPLIIDEMDHIVTRNLVEMVLDLYEASNQRGIIVLIGEEGLKIKLNKWQKFFNRILDWKKARPADLDDVRLLHKFYGGEVTIGDDLCEKIRDTTNGTVREICINLDNVVQEAEREGWSQVGLKEWGNRPFSVDLMSTGV